MIELRFFRSVPFAGASAIAVSAFAALGGLLFLNTLYLQQVRGLSPLQAGLYMLPIAAMTMIFSPLSGRLVGRGHSRVSLLVGGLGVMAGGALLTHISRHTPLDSLLPAYLLFGVGFGMVNPPITATAVLGDAGCPGGRRGGGGIDLATGRSDDGRGGGGRDCGGGCAVGWAGFRGEQPCGLLDSGGLWRGDGRAGAPQHDGGPV